VKPRLASAGVSTWGLGPRPAAAALPVPGTGIGRPAGLRLRLSADSSVATCQGASAPGRGADGRKAGAPEGKAGGARERTPGSALGSRMGIGRSRGRARGSSRLQKSARDAHPAREGWVRPSSMEGVRERPRPSLLTRRRRSRACCPEAKGMRQRCWIRRGARGGRQRSCRKPDARSRTPPAGEGAQRSLRSGLHQDRAPSHPGSLRGSRVVAAGPKLELRRQARLHLVGSSGMRIGEAPEPRRRGHGPG